MKYSIIVLCGGLGTRLPSSANSRGKILAPIGSKLFIDYFLKWLNLNNAKTDDLIFALGYKSSFILDYIKKIPFSIKTSCEKSQKGTLPAIISAKKIALSNDLLILNGDTIFDVCFEKMYLKFKEDDNHPLLSLKKINAEKSGYKFKKNGFLKFVNENAEFISCGAFFCKKDSLVDSLLNKKEWGDYEKYNIDIFYLNKFNPKPFFCGQDYMIDIGNKSSFLEAQKLLPKLITI
jgi:NDP-sugar pyrophosphorylase family protein